MYIYIHTHTYAPASCIYICVYRVGGGVLPHKNQNVQYIQMYIHIYMEEVLVYEALSYQRMRP